MERNALLVTLSQIWDSNLEEKSFLNENFKFFPFSRGWHSSYKVIKVFFFFKAGWEATIFFIYLTEDSLRLKNLWKQSEWCKCHWTSHFFFVDFLRIFIFLFTRLRSNYARNRLWLERGGKIGDQNTFESWDINHNAWEARNLREK